VEDGHALWVVLEIRRLYCRQARKTVSLLPDFCFPRRQYGPAAVGFLLECLIILKLSFLAAVRKLRPEAERHSLAQELVAGVVRRRAQITAYVGALRHRVEDPPLGLSGRCHEAALLFLPLREGFETGASALLHHNAPFHGRYGVGLV
jgi:hypothetical protein